MSRIVIIIKTVLFTCTHMDEKDRLTEGQGSRTRLYLAVASTNFLYVCIGCVMAWTSPTLPKLGDELNEEQASLVGALYSLGAAFGPIITALCLDNIGRKGTLYALGGCFFLSWIVLAISTNVYVLFIGRIIGGFGVGGTFCSASVFVAEMADNKSRGALGSINQASIALGFLIEFCIGPYVNYLMLVIVSAIPVIIFFITFFFIPESPYYLLIKNRKSEAVESLRWFRGNVLPKAVQMELKEIEDSIKLKKDQSGGIRALFRRGPQKALLISFYLLIIQQGCGNNAIVGFAEHIFELGHVVVSGSICAIIGGCTNFIAGLATPFIVRRFSIKIAYLASTFGVAVSLGLLSLYFYLEATGSNVSSISFLPILGYILFNVFYCWGCGPLPWAFVAEMFPLQVKGLGASICGVFASLVGFAVIEIIAIFLQHSGPTIVFAALCIFIALAAFGAVFLLPNTSGLSLQEIHDYLQTGDRPEKGDDNKS